MKEIDYVQVGDYLIPDIELEHNRSGHLGKYGLQRKTYLQEHNSILFNQLVLSEKLYEHLYEIQETATRRVEQLMKELLETNPAPNKKEHQLEWVQHMNMLKAQAEEIVLDELIYR